MSLGVPGDLLTESAAKAHTEELVNKTEKQPLLPKNKRVPPLADSDMLGTIPAQIFKENHPSSLLAWGGFAAGGHLW